MPISPRGADASCGPRSSGIRCRPNAPPQLLTDALFREAQPPLDAGYLADQPQGTTLPLVNGLPGVPQAPGLAVVVPLQQEHLVLDTVQPLEGEAQSRQAE